MAELIINRPFLVRDLRPRSIDMGSRTDRPAQYRAPMTEDEEDRLALLAAAERYEGQDWRATFEPIE